MTIMAGKVHTLVIWSPHQRTPGDGAHEALEWKLSCLQKRCLKGDLKSGKSSLGRDQKLNKRKEEGTAYSLQRKPHGIAYGSRNG